MKYGYFDNKNREYVITNPMTPSPWINYIGNGKFGGIISATGGGLTFDSDPSTRRVTRYKFYNLPCDRPGRYLYIRNDETDDYWSATWQPVMKETQEYECRHGLGYSKILGKYDGVKSEVTFCVPLGKRYELWQVQLENTSEEVKKLKVFSYVEFSWNDAKYDMLAHWPAMAFKADYDGKKILVDTVAEQLTGRPQYDYIATNLQVCGYDCSLKKFIGEYRSETNPIAVERGTCSNTKMYSENCVGVLCSEITLEPGETITFRYTLGATDKKEEADVQIADAFTIENSIEDIKEYWQKFSSNFVAKTPNEDMNTMLNIWNMYQAKTTFDWSRFISIYQKGVDRGWGFRDSMQDVLGVMHACPEEVKERLKILLSIQIQDGSARRVIYPATGRTEAGGRSDDHLWCAFSVCTYIKETGDVAFLDEVLPFDDVGEATVKEHLRRGVEFTMNHLGKHGIPELLLSDWDDSLKPINGDGTWGAESIFVFFQLGQTAYELRELYTFIGDKKEATYMQGIFEYCQSKLDDIWDGEWYIRAFTPSGEKYCTNEDEMNKIHLIPQAWSVLSHLSDEKRANQAMDNALKYLYTDMGLITHYPASEGFDLSKKSYFLFPSGARENGGIFFHSNTWPIIALTMLGRADEAFKCYENMIPIRRNDIADKCLTEPYVYSQTMNAPPHPEAWAAVNSWLTGTASWTYLAATQYILGIRPEYKGLCIDPQIPSDWEGFAVTRRCRGKEYQITVQKGSEKGLYVQGVKTEDNVIPWDITSDKCIEVQLIR